MTAGGGGNDDVVEVVLEVLSSVLRYDVRDDAWFKCTPLGTLRFDFACTVCGNKIYIAGGQCRLGSARGISSAEVYDSVLDTWEALPNMSTLRYKCVGVTWQGRVHVVGGFAGRGDSWDTKERSSAEVYDPDGAKWEVIVGMWQLDVPPNQIVGVGGKLFSSGDCLNSWKGHIEAYDAELNIWKVVEGSSNMSFPISTPTNERRLYLTMAPIWTDIFFLGGYRIPEGEVLKIKSVVHVFKTTSNGGKWWSFEPIEEVEEKELCSHGCVAG